MRSKNNRRIEIFLILIIVGGFIIFFLFPKNKKGVIEDYNKNNGIKTTYEYVIKNDDTILHGKFKEYNKSGIKISEGAYVNNEIVGKYTHYYENGIIETEQFKKSSKKTIEGIWYNSKGQIETYAMYDDFGKPCFLIKDMDKEVLRHKGYPLVETYQYKLSNKKRFDIKTEQHLKVGDVLKYNYLLANIPNTKKSFKIENLGLDNNIIKRTTKKTSPINIEVEEILIKKGQNTVRAVVEYKFNDKATPFLKDTVIFNVMVY
jgi:hypothetical protein